MVGVGKYIRSLVGVLSKREIVCVLFYSRTPKYKIEGKNIRSVILSASNRYYFEQIALPIALKKYKADLYHATGNVGVPIFCPVPAVLTVHDLIPLEIENYFSYSPAPLLSEISYKLRLWSSIYGAAKIVAVSQYTKEQLGKRLRVGTDRIKVIYSGCTNLGSAGKLPTNLTGRKYILNHGGIDIRKNLDRLIEAFALVHKNHNEISLVITGENTRMRVTLNHLVKKLKLENSVIFTGYLGDETLNIVIRNATLVCYPTLSEGFGFPILEAFETGIPVVSSSTSSIPEVAGEAALLVNPNSVDAISGAMEKILNDSELAKNIVLKGKARYKEFSWKESADEYIDLYNSIK